MATDKAPGEQRKRTLEALERRFAQAETDLRRQEEHNNKKQRTLIATTPQGNKNKTPSQITNTPSSSDPSISNAPSRKGNVSFLGHSSSQDVEANHPAYFQLFHSVDGNLLSTVSEVSNSKSTVDYVLHELLQHGDSAQKYMQGSKSVKIDNYILLDNVVHKSSMSSNASLRALKSCSKRSKKHMSLKQHKKCGSFDLPPELHKYEIYKQMHEMWKCYINKLVKSVGKNQLAQCLLNADLHGALILVAHCKLDGYTGLNGIMIRETAETFGIITEDNRFKVVPKKLSVFMLQADSWKVTILGDKLASRNMIS
ncbi:ribonuclease P protein subunit p29 [Ipomoea triloba]|uniref:ribonuclease P protein subunit p29 n=1 Tax=Ipomoea triloba TaxID=35885 RepID=UPI00125D725E|nr:ribonuclease P protein subunit p29 [Ipomoea triloba]XP_031091214.1 ribonuclease P protein subunit p29 [Ipomoea triloba]